MIEIDNLCFSYDTEHILKQISAHIKKGEFIAIIGPNGGGKTTFLKLLLGLLSPKKGRLDIDTHAISYVPQRLDFDRKFPVTVKDVVLMGLLSELPWYGHYPKTIQEKCHQALKKLEINHLANHPFGALSGGQAQRTLIARALISNPEVLLLDEPTSNIDTATSTALISLLTAFKGKKTILMVTHHLDHIIKHVDRVFCIQGELTILEPSEVCKHFAYGSYHTPLLSEENCDHE
jgi:zinc transport system ATP-binding protein